MVKKIFAIILSLIDVFLLYSTIGYLVLGIKTPNISGSSATTFTGMYIMSLTFFALFVICTIVLILLAKKIKKQKVK